MKLIRLIIIMVSMMYLLVDVNAQEKVNNSKGEVIILNEDGTWEREEMVSLPKTAESTESEDDGMSEVREQIEDRRGMYSCDMITELFTDKITGKSSVSAKNLITIKGKQKGSISILPMLGGTKTLILSVIADDGGTGCTQKGSKMNILFRNGMRAELKNHSEFNCEGKSTYYLGGVFKHEVDKGFLTMKEIESIRVHTMGGFVDVNLSKEDSKMILHSCYCLIYSSK